MINDEVRIEFDASTQMARLTIGSLRTGDVFFIVPAGGFELGDLHEALLATGYVRPTADAFHLVDFVHAEQLSEMVTAMLSQFNSSGVPTKELLEVQSTVEDYQSGTGTSVAIPLMALAWLDFVVRQDVADESRSSTDIWSKSKFVVECKSHKERRIKQLVKRYSLQTPVPLRRMTPSSTTLSTDREARSVTG